MYDRLKLYSKGSARQLLCFCFALPH